MAATIAPSSQPSPHLLIITFPAIGHIFPQLKLAHQLLNLGLKLTFLSTPKNLKYLKPLTDLHTPDKLQTLILPFPNDVPGMPQGVENLIDLPGLHSAPLLMQAYAKLSVPVCNWIRSNSDPPVAIMSDHFFSDWTQKLAVDLGIKRIGFSPMTAHTVYHNWDGQVDPEANWVRANMESWALIFNTFEGYDDEYVLFHKQRIKEGRVFAVGPLESVPEINKEKDKVMEWLDDESLNHADNSVVYIGFGTQVNFNKTQVNAIAEALEASQCKFIWVIKVPRDMNMMMVESYDQTERDILTAIGVPESFIQKASHSQRGIVTTKWVMQKEILKHRAVGAYLTHGGWNSVIEGLIGGVVMLIWPMQADHYDNARRLVDELKVAIRVCKGLEAVPDSVELANVLFEAVRGGDEYGDLRKGAIELGKKAVGAIEEKTGSSLKSVEKLVEQVKALGLGGHKVENGCSA